MNKQEMVKIIEWATGENIGSSSKYLCRFMLGLELDYWKAAPLDKNDRSRCIQLLNIIPEWWSKLDNLRYVSKGWNEQVPLIQKERYE